jgi:hypothetical protein
MKSSQKIREKLLLSIEGGQYHPREKVQRQSDLSYDNYLSIGLALKECVQEPERHDELIQRLMPHCDVIIGVLPPGLQSQSLLPPSGAIETPQIERKLADISDEDIRQWIIDDGSLVYGELDQQELHNYFAELAPRLKPWGQFVDLGSGLGKVVITAALNHPFTTCQGVELLAYRHKLAQQRLADLLDAVALELQGLPCPETDEEPIQLPWGNQIQMKHIKGLENRIQFFEGDMFAFDVSKASLVFIYSTCFGSLMPKLAQKLANEAPTGCLVTTTTYSIDHPAFELLQRYTAPQMAWTDVFLYCLKGDRHWMEVTPTISSQRDRAEWEIKVRELLSQITT